MRIESELLDRHVAVECAIVDPHVGLRCISNPQPHNGRVVINGIDHEGATIVANVIVMEVRADPIDGSLRMPRTPKYFGVGEINGIPGTSARIRFNLSDCVLWFPDRDRSSVR